MNKPMTCWIWMNPERSGRPRTGEGSDCTVALLRGAFVGGNRPLPWHLTGNSQTALDHCPRSAVPSAGLALA